MSPVSSAVLPRVHWIHLFTSGYCHLLSPPTPMTSPGLNSQPHVFGYIPKYIQRASKLGVKWEVKTFCQQLPETNEKRAKVSQQQKERGKIGRQPSFSAQTPSPLQSADKKHVPNDKFVQTNSITETFIHSPYLNEPLRSITFSCRSCLSFHD